MAAATDGRDGVAEPSPEQAASLLSRLTFAWVTPLIRLGNSKVLQAADLPPLCHRDSTAAVAPGVREAWERERTRTDRPPSLARALIRAFLAPFVAAGALKLFHDLLQLASPLLLQQIILHLSMTSFHVSTPPLPYSGTSTSFLDPTAAAISISSVGRLPGPSPLPSNSSFSLPSTLTPTLHRSLLSAPLTPPTAPLGSSLPSLPPAPALLAWIFFPLLSLVPHPPAHPTSAPAASLARALSREAVHAAPPLSSGASSSLSLADSLPAWLPGLLLALVLLACNVCQSLIAHQYFHRLYRLSSHVRTGLVSLIYSKALRISAAARHSTSLGEIVNLQSNDAEKLAKLCIYLHIVWSGPVQIIGALAFLFRFLSVIPALAGLATMLLLMPFNGLLMGRLSAVRHRLIARTDARVRLLTETVGAVRAVKLNGWEALFRGRIEARRADEMKEITASVLLEAMGLFVYYLTPMVVSVVSLAAYVLLGRPLTADVAFPALALFNLLRFPLAMIPDQINDYVQAKVSAGRVEKFLLLPEIVPLEEEPGSVRGSIKLRNASFSWGGRGDSSAIKSGGGGINGPGGSTSDSGSNGGRDGSSNAVAVAVNGTGEGGEKGKEGPEKEGVKEGGEEGEQALALCDVTLEIPPGQLVIVVGEVGAGKSSLLAGLLGEITRVAGSVSVAGRVAYTSQDPWILNATVRDNILMGGPAQGAVDEARYQRVRDACALRHDLAMLAGGDMAEIGERGINLSGGQKHRVALARAVYSQPDVVLLDDPLSAVDTHVGRHLFTECICGELAGTTRVLVTHQLQYASHADVIIAIKAGRVAAVGTFDELQGRGVDLALWDEKQQEQGEQGTGTWQHSAPAAPATAVTAATASDPGDISSSSSSSSSSGTGKATEKRTTTSASMADSDNDLTRPLLTEPPSSVCTAASGAAPTAGSTGGGSGSAGSGSGGGKKKQKAVGQLVEEEGRAEGGVAAGVYWEYMRAWGGRAGFLMPLLVLAVFAVSQSLKVASDTWLAVWTAKTSQGTSSAPFFLLIYSLATFATGLLSSLRGILLALGSLTAARSLHSRLLSRVLRLPMAFFDSQPSGRLLNRFTRDMEQIDLQLPDTLLSYLSCLFQVVFAILVIVIVTPPFLLPLIPLLLLYRRIQTFYISASRELKRLDSLARSPIFAHFSETLTGLSTVRAFRRQLVFSVQNNRNLDRASQAYLAAMASNRWLGLRLELIGASCVFATACFCVVGGVAAAAAAAAAAGGGGGSSSTGSWAAGFAGLALTSALSITGYMNWMVRMNAELESQMNAVERILEYTTLPTEAPDVVESCRPPVDWPQQGVIEAEGVVVRYRPELPPVLKGLTFSIRAGEKVGVCGRTGSGKTTLSMALYRIVELSAGRIVIDGVDAATIGLRDLRSRLSLVPQDPVVFSGSIRWNLDPYSAASAGVGGESEMGSGGHGEGKRYGGGMRGDVELWEALTQAGVADAVRALPGQLDAEVAEGGGNLSVGQRQLLCLARALLRRSHVLVLDEATSNVDTATDAAVQAAVRGGAFAACTVVTIAHRLHTIVDCHRVMLLEDGHVAELDSPTALLQVRGSRFSAFVDATMPREAAALRRIASAKSIAASEG